MANILITGCAGFIGHAVAKKLLDGNSKQTTIVGIDNFDPYYSREYKQFRVTELLEYSSFKFFEGSILSKPLLTSVFKSFTPTVVIHTAAKVGVSGGQSNPIEYMRTNVIGTLKLLEVLQQYKPNHFISFSSSSVYGAHTKSKTISLSEELPITYTTPLSVYGLSKITAESLLSSFAATANVSTTVIRPFSVYGPYGRPDMLPARVVHAALLNKELTLFNQSGANARDWTYISDLRDFIIQLASSVPTYLHKAVNVGTGSAISIDNSVQIMRSILEKRGYKLKTNTAEGRSYESLFNQADNRRAVKMGYQSTVSLEVGLSATIDFFLSHPEFL